MRYKPATPYMLYVDDDPHECELVTITADIVSDCPRIDTLHGVQDTIEYFEKLASPGALSEPPSLLLLDYHLGPHTGAELLSTVRSRSLFSGTAICLSSCDARETIHSCYGSGAACFLLKPDCCDRLQTILRALGRCIASGGQVDCLKALKEFRGPDAASDPHTTV